MGVCQTSWSPDVRVIHTFGFIVGQWGANWSPREFQHTCMGKSLTGCSHERYHMALRRCSWSAPLLPKGSISAKFHACFYSPPHWLGADCASSIIGIFSFGAWNLRSYVHGCWLYSDYRTSHGITRCIWRRNPLFSIYSTFRMFSNSGTNYSLSLHQEYY